MRWPAGLKLLLAALSAGDATIRGTEHAELPAHCGAVLNAQMPWGAGRLWTRSLLPAIYTALVAGAATGVSGLLMLSTLASDELREVLAATLLSVGSSVSGYAM